MSGLVKAKKYDWKDSNMAMFGSDTEKHVKKESAESEPAWQTCGQECGLKIWRIVKFKVECWPKEDYGKFYEGDSYIILNTYNEADSDELLYDVHFWIGKQSTQDEYGTAAYKTVELDTFLDDKPIQHREVQRHESEMFKSYFKEVTYLKGGADTGFRHVTPEEYTPRLLRFQKVGQKTTVTEVARCRSQLHDGDVFILDLGLTLIQWNGQNCNNYEKFAAAQRLQDIVSERRGQATKQVLDQSDMSPEHSFYSNLDEDEDDDDEVDEDEEIITVTKKVCDADGSLDIEDFKEGDISLADLQSEDVFIIDTTKKVFAWIGNGASVDERHQSFLYAHNYLQGTKHPLVPIVVINEGQETKNKAFMAALTA